jgi:hypothetical protein
MSMDSIYNRDSIYNTRDNIYNRDSSIFNPVEDISTVFGGRRGVGHVTLLSFEELVSHPLFREYLEIPLFRQFLETRPVVFRRYVESVLFQQFWKVPEFMTYFRNPVFFYKYIVPQLQVIAETVVPSTSEGIYDETSRFNPYTTSSTYGYQPRYNNRDWSVPMSSMYGRQTGYPTSTTSNTYNKYLLEKMMSHMNVNNKMGERVTETLTDVKMLPSGQVKEQTFGKIVDPITGQEKITVGDVKLVDEKIVQGMDSFPFGIEKYNLNKIFGTHTPTTKTIKDILLKHIILNKVYGDKRIVSPEVYSILFGEHKEIFPEMYNTIVKSRHAMTPEFLSSFFNKKTFSPEVFDTMFSPKKTFTPEIFDTLFGEHKKVLTPELVEILMKGNKHVMSPRVLETVFGKKVYTPEVFGKLFNNYNDEQVFNINSGEDRINRYNVDVDEFEPMTYNKFNKFGVAPLLTRMLKNKAFPKVDTETMEKIQVQKMIEEIQKEKVMEKLIKNKEHSVFNVDSEVPTMTGRFHHIPLTFGKPVVGSNIEEFQQDKEIKW